MTIRIISSYSYNLGGIYYRAAKVGIKNGGEVEYLWNVGGLPSSGNLLDILKEKEEELFRAARDSGVLLQVEDITKIEALEFLVSYPAARNIIKLSLPDLLTAIDNRTASQETLLLKTLAVAVRYLYEQEKMT